MIVGISRRFFIYFLTLTSSFVFGDVLNYVPDSAGFLLYVQNIEEVSSKWKNHTLSSSIQLSSNGKEMWDDFLLEKEKGMESLKQLVDPFGGEFAFYLDLETLSCCALLNSSEDINTLLSRINDMKSATSGSSAIPVEDEFKEEEHLGVRLFSSKKGEKRKDDVMDAFSFALTEEVLIFSDSQELVKNSIYAIQKGLDSSINDSSSFLDMIDTFEGRNADIWSFIDINKCIDTLFNHLELKGIKIPSNDFMVTNDSIRQGLALDEIQSLFTLMNIEEEQIFMELGLSYRKEAGLIKMLAYTDTEVESPIFVPKDVFSSTIANFSFSKFWSALEESIKNISPQLFASYKMMLSLSEAQLQMNIEEDLINNLGDQLASFSTIVPDSNGAVPQNEQLIALSLIDQQSVEIAFNKILMRMGGEDGGMISKEEYMGNSLYIMNAPTPQGQVSFALGNNTLYLSMGDVGNLRRILSNLASDSKSLWNEDHLKQKTQDLFDAPVSLAYSDYSQLFELINTNLFQNPQAMQFLNNAKNQSGLNFAKMLENMEIHAPFMALGGIERSEGLIRSKGVIVPKK